MSVTDETSQDEMLPLKEVVPLNMLAMSVIPETFQPERSPSNEEASLNMFFVTVTPERSGTSVEL